MQFFLLYLIAVNLLGIIVVFIDKYSAKHHKRRIAEKHLFALSILGASAGMYASMRLFHHKTLHKRFMIGLKLIFIFEFIITFFFVKGLISL